MHSINQIKKKRIAIIMILVSLPCIFLDVLLPVYTHELGYSTIQMTMLFSIFSLSTLVMRLLAGRWMDQYSYKPLLLCSLLIYTGAYCTFSITDSLYGLMLGQVLQGMANVILSISIYGIIMHMRDSLAQNIGWIDSLKNLGGLLGVGLCFFILTKYGIILGWHFLFAICSASTLFVLIYFLLTWKEPKQYIAVSNVVLPQVKYTVLLINGFFCMATSMIYAILIPYLQTKYRTSLEIITISFLLPILIASISGPLLGKLGDCLGYRYAVIMALFACTISMTLMILATNIYIFSIVWVAFSLGSCLLRYSIDAMFMKDIPDNNTGEVMAKYSIGSSIGKILGPILGGVLFDLCDIRAPFFLFVGCFLIGVPLFSISVPRNK